MGKKWKKWAEDKGLMKWFQKENFIVLVLMGILLVIIALPTKSGESDESGDSGRGTVNGPEGTGLPGGNLPGTGTAKNTEGTGKEEENGKEETPDTDREYARYLEARLTELLSRMAGAGKVRVMITLKSSRELVVEKEEPVSRSTTNEKDSQGGSRIVSQMDSGENTVYRTEGSYSEPYVIMTLPPQIEGVVVVAEGAGNGTVNRTIVEIVQALFDVEAHKVRVVPMGTE